jgi:hypothetical protein
MIVITFGCAGEDWYEAVLEDDLMKQALEINGLREMDTGNTVVPATA